MHFYFLNPWWWHQEYCGALTLCTLLVCRCSVIETNRDGERKDNVSVSVFYLHINRVLILQWSWIQSTSVDEARKKLHHTVTNIIGTDKPVLLFPISNTVDKISKKLLCNISYFLETLTLIFQAFHAMESILLGFICIAEWKEKIVHY